MSRPHRHPDTRPTGCLLVVVVPLGLFALICVIGYFRSYALIPLTFVAILWYISRSTKPGRFGLRSLFVITAGVAVIIASAALMQVGGAMGLEPVRVSIRVFDQGTTLPIPRASVRLTSPDWGKSNKHRGRTDSHGKAVFDAKRVVKDKYSILREWTVREIDDLSLLVRAEGYQTVEGDLTEFSTRNGVDAISVRVGLRRKRLE
jgi:hypothetical protein